MVAFHNSNELKERCLELAYGARWDGGEQIKELASKGQYSLSEHYGIPVNLCQILYQLTLNVSETQSINESFLELIQVGQNLNKTSLKFILTVLATGTDHSNAITKLEKRRSLSTIINKIVCCCENLINVQLCELPNFKEEKDQLLAMSDQDPVRKLLLVTLDILDYWQLNKNKFNESFDDTKYCYQFVELVDYIWQEFDIKDRGTLLRDILFKCIVEEAQLPTV